MQLSLINFPDTVDLNQLSVSLWSLETTAVHIIIPNMMSFIFYFTIFYCLVVKNVAILSPYPKLTDSSDKRIISVEIEIIEVKLQSSVSGRTTQ